MGNVNCLRCRFRHEDNGNCTAVGGFCTAVTAAHCPLLRQYLDTGMTPEQCENAKAIIESAFSDDTSKAERIRELLKADRAGRLVVLPCKVGDTVYFRTYDCNGTVDLGIQPHKVTAIVGHAIVRFCGKAVVPFLRGQGLQLCRKWGQDGRRKYGRRC